jgi:hypothetical protein
LRVVLRSSGRDATGGPAGAPVAVGGIAIDREA